MRQSEAERILPIAFMIMPFGKKRPEVNGERVPDEIDFDELWEQVFKPVLARSHTPFRADEDFGAHIIKDMIQRLAAADLVIAEISLQNSNVYYEIGVRHAARQTGCVLVAAEWAEPSFDLAQIRQLRYPLPESPLSDESRARALRTFAARFEELAGSDSPVFDAVPGFPDPDPTELSSFRDYAREMNRFHERVSEIRQIESGRKERTAALTDAYPAQEQRSKAVAWQVLMLIRDFLEWEHLLAYIEDLPHPLRDDPDIREQEFLAIGKSGDPAVASVRLQTMIEQIGKTPERSGILGGRYKQLWRAAEPSSVDRRRYLKKAIAAYEDGMYADLNEYYCASNLPRLYRALDPTGSDARAKAARAAEITLAACHRAMAYDRGDEFLRPTLLGMAFEAGQLEEVRRLVEEVKDSDRVAWKLDTTVTDIRDSVGHHDEPLRTKLRVELRTLEELL